MQDALAKLCGFSATDVIKMCLQSELMNQKIQAIAEPDSVG